MITRRGFIKWSTALVAVGAAVVGVGAGYGADLLLRPSAESKTTQTATTTTVTQPAQTITKTVTATAPQEVLLTMAEDGGPLYAHVVNGVWTSSSPIAPNVPVGANTFWGRNRNYSPDRIAYPMKRVDFDVNNRNTQNRGKSGFVRMSWDDAINLVAGELSRVKSTYGNGAVFATSTDHQWIGQLHNSGGSPMLIYPPTIGPSGWGSRFWSLFGGLTMEFGSHSNPANNAGGPLAFGMGGTTSTNNSADILANSKMVIHWATDTATKSYSDLTMNLWLQKFRDAGIKQVVIDPYYNDTAAVYGAQWIPIVPNTDEAMLVAIAYVWFTQNLIDETFAQSHTLGYSQFKDYVLGKSDGTPKTPQWASAITGVSQDVITQLAKDWASLPTYVQHATGAGGANRRTNGAQWVRLLIVLSTISGNIGKPGRGLGGLSYSTTGVGQTAFGSVPTMTVPLVNLVPHVTFADAILKPPVTFGSVGTDGKWYSYTYPNPNTPQVKLIGFHSDNGFFMNQVPDTAGKVKALQSSNIEFIFTMGCHWGSGTKFSDVVLPTRFLGERDDIVMWQNYAIYMHAVANPAPEAWNDLDIYTALAKKLGFDQQLTGGKTPDQWLRQLYATSSVPMTFDEFKAAGYYKFPPPAQTPTVNATFTNFNADPVKNKLPTTSGLVEITSQVIASTLGANSPYVMAQYVPPAEGFDNPLAKTYPLIMLTPHPKFGRHSQWQNISWVKANDQGFRNGYRTAYVNSTDAKSRGINDGDVVKVFNQRGTIICTATITERCMPRTIYVWEGAWYQPQKPGDPTSVDLGGDPNVLIDNRFGELTSGMIANALVDVQKWSGS